MRRVLRRREIVADQRGRAEDRCQVAAGVEILCGRHAADGRHDRQRAHGREAFESLRTGHRVGERRMEKAHRLIEPHVRHLRDSDQHAVIAPKIGGYRNQRASLFDRLREEPNVAAGGCQEADVHVRRSDAALSAPDG